MSLNVGHERTILAVSDGNVCQFTRVIEWGGGKLAAAIERELHISAKDAQDLLLQLSFDAAQPAAPAAPASEADRPTSAPSLSRRPPRTSTSRR